VCAVRAESVQSCAEQFEQVQAGWSVAARSGGNWARAVDRGGDGEVISAA
jgi:hypothetical protein